MLGYGKLEPQPNPLMPKGKFSTIWVFNVFLEVATIFGSHYFFEFFLQSSKLILTIYFMVDELLFFCRVSCAFERYVGSL
jgi:hypothetical protein